MLLQHLPIFGIQHLKLECAFYSFTLKRRFPAPALGTQIRSTTSPLTRRVDRNVAIWQPD